MPTESTREKIAAEALEWAKGIRVANGFWNDIKDENVSRYLRTFDQIMSMQMPFLEMLAGTGSFEHHGTYRREASPMEITWVGWVRSEDPEILATVNERLIKDLMQRLLANPTLVTTNFPAGLTRDIHLDDVVPFQGVLAAEGFAMFELSTRYDYVFDWADP